MRGREGGGGGVKSWSIILPFSLFSLADKITVPVLRNIR